MARYHTRLAARTAAAPVAAVDPVAPVAPAAPVVAVAPADPVVAPVVALVARLREGRTRLAAARKKSRIDEATRRFWDSDGPRVLYIMRSVTRRLLSLLSDLRRAYRTKPYSWIAENFESRLKVFREQGEWIGAQLRPHSTAVIAQLEFAELAVALESCIEMCNKVRQK
jgi:hypothetical protein